MSMEPKTPLSSFELDYAIQTDSQDIAATLESIAYDEPDATGVATRQADGEFLEVWVTTSSRPWNLDSLYRRIK